MSYTLLDMTISVDGRTTRWAQHNATRRRELVEAALRAIRHHGHSVGMDDIAAEARSFEDWARGRGYEVIDSQANFSLIGRFPDRHRVWQDLLDRGILIRETGPAGFLRVSAGTPEEMALLRSALDEIDPTLEGRAS